MDGNVFVSETHFRDILRREVPVSAVEWRPVSLICGKHAFGLGA